MKYKVTIEHEDLRGLGSGAYTQGDSDEILGSVVLQTLDRSGTVTQRSFVMGLIACVATEDDDEFTEEERAGLSNWLRQKQAPVNVKAMVEDAVRWYDPAPE